MKIGELAARTNTPVETIRYYEREGLLPPPGRTAGNYRVYGEPHVERLQLVRNCRALDMTLGEIRRLLHACDSPADNCAEINALLDEHIEHVATRIAELKALQKTLKALRSQCRGNLSAKDCGILQGLSASPEPARRTVEHKHGLLGPTHG
ncbi:Cd(II)/Pb(II)-responsive transcriptional regulator [Pigmentiphaga sp.]|uniref:Cd(II)/Pb(II)-responsive transcriptional regulator n=1 Tax=Pigmentiphaga sp. TaxID=1977564 RepID=UPI0025E1D3B6|nr:Cd(II)/Pb(II)-responsive transcriptional regulator [Pigmentiphaga sp.]MBX6318713.1 Cd(II)/Pb(II)-responsive transcriptional regulator [Pigmentiphaga sp.]